MEKIGVIGLGNMGGGIAKNLCKANIPTLGFDVSNKQIEKFESHGGIRADSITAIAQNCKSIFIMVMNKKQVHSIVDELFETMTQDQTIIITATIEPSEVKDIARKAQERHINIIDSPVSGGLSGAESGTLTLMAAAETRVLDANRVYLEAISSSIHHVGEEPGLGQTVKAALQVLIGVSYVGIFEALTLGAKAGLSGQVMFDVFTTSAVRSPLLENAIKLINDRTFENSGSHIDTMHKDLGISTLFARELQVPAFTANTAFELFEIARAKYPQGDNWIIVKLLEEITQTKVEW